MRIPWKEGLLVSIALTSAGCAANSTPGTSPTFPRQVNATEMSPTATIMANERGNPRPLMLGLIREYCQRTGGDYARLTDPSHLEFTNRTSSIVVIGGPRVPNQSIPSEVFPILRVNLGAEVLLQQYKAPVIEEIFKADFIQAEEITGDTELKDYIEQVIQVRVNNIYSMGFSVYVLPSSGDRVFIDGVDMAVAKTVASIIDPEGAKKYSEENHPEEQIIIQTVKKLMQKNMTDEEFLKFATENHRENNWKIMVEKAYSNRSKNMPGEAILILNNLFYAIKDGDIKTPDEAIGKWLLEYYKAYRGYNRLPEAPRRWTADQQKISRIPQRQAVYAF